MMPAIRCAGCHQPIRLFAWGYPRWCHRCAVVSGPWNAAPFGKVRKVPPWIAAQWDDPIRAHAA